ncbi:sodium:calcium antiporter [Pseudomonas profundi]|uniref:sodium:calcium antiporter n=1 Tax=Pseudomonas profundi TaxID=1981513 RepID=UPI00123B0F30|nr:sodium:calcium antiporter [Pseudomonas profundi]
MDLFDPSTWSLTVSILVFCLCAGVITVLGTLITRVVDQLADRTGLGEAVVGAVLLGAATSLSGAVLSVTAAWNGNPELALANALGGIAVQTLFLVVADMTHTRANLEHAAASAPNMLQNALLITLLGVILLSPNLPDVIFWNIHPVTPTLLALYVYGINLVSKARNHPMWHPQVTDETREDTPDDDSATPSLAKLWVSFIFLMGGLGIAGWLLEPAATNIARLTGIGQTTVGVLLTAISTSIPELVTSVAAVRRGALTLAVGGIVGGNAFDTLFTAASDIAYRGGSIYHVMSGQIYLWISLTLVMAAVLMMGLIRRQEQGPGRVGVESVAIVLLYLLGVAILLMK